ncbi:MAG: hypothetical protein IJ430_02330 [Parabacteroides sp.]|nr:hypothetical protein [Parabacteroides sp.]
MRYLLSILCIGICFSFLKNSFFNERYNRYKTFPEERKVTTQEISLQTDFRYPYRIAIKENMAILMDLHPNEYFYHVYSYPDWQPIATFGKRGEGPKEVLSADGIRFYSSDSIYTLDANRMIITRWTLSPEAKAVSRAEDIPLNKSLIRSLDFYRTDKNFLIPNYSGECRYHKVSHDGQSIQNIGKIPTEEHKENRDVALAQAWRTFTDYNPKNDIYVLVTQLGEVIEVHNLKTEKQFVIYGPGGEPAFKKVLGEGIPTGIKGFMDVQVTDQAIYAIFDGLSWEERKKYQVQGKRPPEGGHFLYQFDLAGNPIRKYTIDKNIYGLEIDEKKNQVIATCLESDSPIVTFQL